MKNFVFLIKEIDQSLGNNEKKKIKLDDYFGFNIQAADIEEAEELVMKPIEEENFAGEIEECEK